MWKAVPVKPRQAPRRDAKHVGVFDLQLKPPVVRQLQCNGKPETTRQQPHLKIRGYVVR